MNVCTQFGLQPRDILAPSAALLTLLFTVGSFWWTNWRRGRIIVGRPRTYSYAPARDRTILLIPLPLSNTGAKPIVLSALRLRSPDNQQIAAPQVRTRTAALPKSEGVDFASAISVGGRESLVAFPEFQAEPSFRLSDGRNRLVLEAWLEHKQTWKRIGTVELYAKSEDQRGKGENLVPYDNIDAF